MSLALTSMAFIAAYVGLTWSREREAHRYHELIHSDDVEIAQFKESVRLLAGVVEILRKDSEELRQGHLVGEIDLDARPSHDPSGPSALTAIDDATAALLALPSPEPQAAARRTGEAGN